MDERFAEAMLSIGWLHLLRSCSPQTRIPLKQGMKLQVSVINNVRPSGLWRPFHGDGGPAMSRRAVISRSLIDS